MEKLPINTNVPLFVGEDEIEAYGQQVWAFHKKPNLPYGFITFDKYWRKAPSWWSSAAGEFATEEERAAAVPISEVPEQYREDRSGLTAPTDNTNYDHLFEIEAESEVEVPEKEPEAEKEPEVKPVEKPAVVLASPTWGKIVRIFGQALDKIADVLEGD